MAGFPHPQGLMLLGSANGRYKSSWGANVTRSITGANEPEGFTTQKAPQTQGNASGGVFLSANTPEEPTAPVFTPGQLCLLPGHPQAKSGSTDEVNNTSLQGLKGKGGGWGENRTTVQADMALSPP